MANKEVILNFKAKVSTDVGDIKKILANLETQMGALTIPESSFKNFKDTIEKINKELINFESLTEQGSDNLADTKKIEKSWEKVTTLLYNVQGQLKNMGKNVDIFPRTVLDNISKATGLLDNYNKKLKQVKESEEYTAKATELSSKKKEQASAKKRVDKARETVQDRQIKATAAEEAWKTRETDYNEKENLKARKKAEREDAERFLQEQKEERQKMRRSKMFTAEGEISSSVYTEVKKAQEETARKQEKLAQAQKDFDAASKKAANAKGRITKYKNKSKKSDEELKTDQQYLDLVEKSKVKTNERTAAEDKLTKATQAHQEAQDLLTASLLKRDAAEQVYNNIDSSEKRVSELRKEENALKDVNKENENYRRTNAEAQRQLQLANTETDAATKAYNQCEQAVEQLDQELKQMEVDQTTKEWDELVKAIKEITGVDLTPFAGDVDKVAKALKEYKLDEVEKTPSVASQAETAFNGMVPAIDRVTNAADNMNRELSETERRAQEIAQVKDNIMDFFSISNTIDIFKDSVRNAFDTVKELDAVMTEMAVVTDYSIEDMWGKLPEYTKIASELGVATKEFYEAITLYFQQGLSEEQSVELAIETLKMGRIANMEGAEATEAMTAALRGFNMELNQMNAQHVNDVYSKLAAVTASDTNQIATAISKTASIAKSANMDLETTAAFLAQIIETTQEAPETAGTALKTIIARFSEVKELKESGENVGADEEGEEIDVNKIETALRKVGISMDKFFAGEQGLDEIFLELSKKWNTLDFETQHYIATVAAGSRQQSRFMAMMSNYERTIELVGEAYNSSGASQEQFDKTMESLSSKLNQLHNAWTNFTMGLANSEIIKGVIDFLTIVLNLINDITEKLSGSNGLIRAAYNAIILLSGLTLGKNLVGGAGNIIGTFLGKGAAAGAAATTAAGAAGAASKLSSMKAMKWLLASSIGITVGDAINGIFDKEDKKEDKKEKDEKKDNKQVETVTINKANKTGETADKIEQIADTSQTISNQLKNDTQKSKDKDNEKTEGQQLLEAFRSGQITAENMDAETTSKIMEALNDENDILKQIEENTSPEDLLEGMDAATNASLKDMFKENGATEAENQPETETDAEEEKGSGFGSFLSGAIGLAATFGSQMLLEAGGEVIGEVLKKKLPGKIGGKVIENIGEKAIKEVTEDVNTASFKNITKNLTASGYADIYKKKYDSDFGVEGLIQNALDKGANNDEIITLLDFINKTLKKPKEENGPEYSIFSKGYEGNQPSKFVYSSADYIELFEEVIDKIIPSRKNIDNSAFSNLDFLTGGKIGSYANAKESSEVLQIIDPMLQKLDNLSTITYDIGKAVTNKLVGVAGKISTIGNSVASAIVPYLGTATAVAIPAALAVGGAVAYSKARENSQIETKIGHRQEQAETKQTQLNELKSAKLAYDDLVAQTNNLKTGSIEWQNSMKQIGEYVNELLQKYPQLAAYSKQLGKDEFIFSDQNWDKFIKEQEEQTKKATDLALKTNAEALIKEYLISTDQVKAKKYSKAEYKDNLSSIKTGEDVSDNIDKVFKEVTQLTKDQFTLVLQGIASSGATFIDGVEYGSEEWNLAVQYIEKVMTDNAEVFANFTGDSEDLMAIIKNYLGDATLEMDNLIVNLRNLGFVVLDTTNDIAAAGDRVSDSSSGNSQSLIDAAVERYRGSQASDPVSYSTQQAEAAAARTASVPTSSVDTAEAVWENNFDRIYNLIELIEEETRARQRIESQYEFMLRTQNATANKILELNVQELLSLERSRQQQKELIEQRTADITMLQLKNQNLAGYASVEKNVYGDSVLRINWDAIEQITDNSLGQAVNDYISQLEEWLDTIYDAEDSLIDIENSVLDIKERGKQEYLDFENRIKDALETYYQEEIDKLSEINDTIDDTNSKIIDSIQKYVNDQRKQRDNERTEKEIEKKQRRLSYLRQDTSNANQVEILTLQEEITLEQEDYTDTLIDQRISELQEQNELAQEQRQHQIEIAQAQLEHYVSTGQIWNDVKQLMDDGLNPDSGVLRGSKLLDILQKAENFQGLSSISKMEWLNDLNNSASQAQSWVATQSAQLLGNDTLRAIKNEIANLDVGSTVNNYYTVGSGSSGGYGNSGYGGSGGGYTDQSLQNIINGLRPVGNNSSSSNASKWYEAPNSPKGISIETSGFYKGKTFYSRNYDSLSDLISAVEGSIIQQYGMYMNGNPPDQGAAQQVYRMLISNLRNGKYYFYKTGGLANFTGPAWLDGTKAKPEYVLNAVQTKGFLTLVDVLDSIKNHTFAPKSENAVGNTYDIDINIETVKEEADINKIAEKVQKSIVATSQYRSNTIIKR